MIGTFLESPDQGPQAARGEVQEVIKACHMAPAGVVIHRSGLLLGRADHVVCPGVFPASLEAAESFPVVGHRIFAPCSPCSTSHISHAYSGGHPCLPKQADHIVCLSIVSAGLEAAESLAVVGHWVGAPLLYLHCVSPHSLISHRLGICKCHTASELSCKHSSDTDSCAHISSLRRAKSQLPSQQKCWLDWRYWSVCGSIPHTSLHLYLSKSRANPGRGPTSWAGILYVVAAEERVGSVLGLVPEALLCLLSLRCIPTQFRDWRCPADGLAALTYLLRSHMSFSDGAPA